MVHESSPYSAIFDLGKLQTGIYAIKLLGEDSAVQIYCRFCNNYADSRHGLEVPVDSGIRLHSLLLGRTPTKDIIYFKYIL
jgi:hypothetical protein